MILCSFLDMLIVIYSSPLLSHPPTRWCVSCYPSSYLLLSNTVPWFCGVVGWSHCIALAVLGTGVRLGSLSMPALLKGRVLESRLL